jgi:hypothetical protein
VEGLLFLLEASIGEKVKSEGFLCVMREEKEKWVF